MKWPALVLVVLVAACNRSTPPPAKLAWLTDEVAAFGRARKEHKLVLIDFAATWSVPSEELDRTLASAEVAPVLDTRYVLLRLDVSNDTEADQEARKRYSASTLPQIVVVDAQGVVHGRIETIREPPALRKQLEQF